MGAHDVLMFGATVGVGADHGLGAQKCFGLLFCWLQGA